MMFRRGSGALVLLAACCEASGCSGAEPPQARNVVRDSAGVAIVEGSSGLWDNASAWRVSEAPVLRIGSDESASPSVGGSVPVDQFTYIRELTRLSDGRIVVQQWDREEIYWFSPDGRHLFTRGGRGAGPGEFTSPEPMVRLAGDTLLVQNNRPIKHVFFGPHGELVREESLDQDSLRALIGTDAECLNLLLPDRSVVRCRPAPGLAFRPTGSGYHRRYVRQVRIPWSLDRLYPLGLDGGLESWGVDAGNGTLAFGRHPFHSMTFTTAGGEPLRIATALNPAYSIELWTPDGVLDRIIRRPGARRALTREELAQARDRITGGVARDPALLNRWLREMQEPDSLPAVYGLNFGPAGDLWVKRDHASEDTPTLYDVFDHEGRFLGEITFPPRFRIYEVGEDYLLGVQTGRYDVQSVAMYALDRRTDAARADAGSP